MEKAMDVYLSSELDDKIKIDSSFSLTSIALELDSKNIQALTHKTTLLYRKKDIEGLIRTVDELIVLKPEIPQFLGQKALFLELKGDTTLAKEYYARALNMYEDYLNKDSLNFDLRLEYIGMLEAAGDTASANREFELMKLKDYKDFQKDILDKYKDIYVSKEKLTKYWTGEISYEQIVGE
ncbi:tetratricopeptide repeat protein [Rufibacter roseus]|uniref:Tetratricopeptide repeat protein n=1 Tax=Rufibacter roseus TaxID=1567108 RepID=A0ABW2DR39_9BACT|nr:hypothetical protein [Rufibacter roseus]